MPTASARVTTENYNGVLRRHEEDLERSLPLKSISMSPRLSICLRLAGRQPGKWIVYRDIPEPHANRQERKRVVRDVWV
jgi:hypothetical protein